MYGILVWYSLHVIASFYSLRGCSETSLPTQNGSRQSVPVNDPRQYLNNSTVISHSSPMHGQVYAEAPVCTYIDYVYCGSLVVQSSIVLPVNGPCNALLCTHMYVCAGNARLCVQ